MTTLTEQLNDLKLQEADIIRKKNKLILEIKFENKTVQELEQQALFHIDEVNKIFTHLRDTFSKVYKLHNGFNMSSTVNVRIIEPRAGHGGYDRYLDYDNTAYASTYSSAADDAVDDDVVEIHLSH